VTTLLQTPFDVCCYSVSESDVVQLFSVPNSRILFVIIRWRPIRSLTVETRPSFRIHIHDLEDGC